eukprot:gene20652-22693_t
MRRDKKEVVAQGFIWEEADTRVALHVFRSDGPVMTKAKDTDIFILMIYAFAVKQPQSGVFKAVKQKSLPLLEKLGDEKSLNADGELDITNFIHRAVYNGKENGGIVTTQINQYDKLRVKTTQSIIPDPGSLKYLIQKANLATYYLKHFSLPVVEKVTVSESGWIREETGHLLPLWYHGPQMPQLVRKRKSGKRKKSVKIASFNTSNTSNTSESSDSTDSEDPIDALTGKTVFTEHGVCLDNKGDYDWLYSSSEEDCTAYNSDDAEYIP